MADVLFNTYSILAWLIHLFNPPPLISMTRWQKVGRVFLLTATLLTISLLSTMVIAAVIFLFQRMPRLVLTLLASDFSVVEKMIAIILLSVCVNTVCVFVLLQIRRMDRGLMKEDHPR
jgi:hypothetical protein